MQKLETYRVNLIIDEHFEKIKNQLDIFIEQLILDNHEDEAFLKELNSIRLKQISLIEEIKKFNLKPSEFDEEAFLTKWDHLIQDESMEYDAKLDLIKPDLITHDCVLIEDLRVKSKMTLWTFKWFNNAANLKIFRYFIYLRPSYK